jgi:hypothetical protein
MSWDEMRGDDRTRFCEQCNLHIYNISELTRKQAGKLIANSEGSFCARLYRRADGTVITKDCPVGLRAIRRRVSRIVGATATAILSLCMSAFGKIAPADLRTGGTHLSFTHSRNGLRGQTDRGEISGRVIDMNGAPIGDARVTIINQDTGKKSKVKTKANGQFQFPMLAAGLYTIQIEAEAFNRFEMANIKLGASETIHEDFTLMVAGGTIGVIVLEELPKSRTGPGTMTVFSGDKARRLPF